MKKKNGNTFSIRKVKVNKYFFSIRKKCVCIRVEPSR